MKKIALVAGCLALSVGLLFAQEAAKPKPKVVLCISEQNIQGPQQSWWASEIDLSATEAAIAQRLIAQGYEVLEPSSLEEILKQKPAFRVVELSSVNAVKMGNAAKADYVVAGKALASAGGNVPQSQMRSCFANISAKVVRVKDSKVIAYLSAQGNSAHLDPVSGGKEALVNAADELAAKIVEAIDKSGS